MSTKKQKTEGFTKEEYLYKKGKLKELRSLISLSQLQFKMLGTKDREVKTFLSHLQDEAYQLESEIIRFEDLNSRSVS